MKLTYLGKVKESGELYIFNRKQFNEDIKIFTGKNIVLTIEKKKRKRSLAFNNYYWGVIVPIVKQGLIDLGYRINLNDTHEFLKYKFIDKELVNDKTGEIMKTIGSTAELTNSEFMDYKEQIQQFAAEYLNVHIPDPGEVLKIDFDK